MIDRRNLAFGAALATAILGFSALPAAAQSVQPSRPAEDKCAWEMLSDASVGLAAWVQRCDFGFRKIDFLFDNGDLSIRYSDGDEPYPVVLVMDMPAGETPEAAVRSLFDAGTDPAIAARCDISPSTLIPAPAGVERFTFVPNAQYKAELTAAADPNEVPEPPCGEWGDAPDGIQYFEIQPDSGSTHVLFVRAGQEAPLFDEDTLKLVAPTPYQAAGPEDCCGYGAGERGVSADFLLETCSVPGQTEYGMIPFFDCQSYVLAVIDTVRSLNAGHNPTICMPPELTAGSALELLDGRYDDEVDGQSRASDILLAALGEKFACTK